MSVPSANVSTIGVLARMGYTARGLVYLTVGSLAVLAAADLGGKTTDSRGAVREIAKQPFGQFLLILLIAGLVGYVIWRCAQALRDTDHHGTSLKGLGVRAGLLISAITHGALAWFTVKLVWFGSEDSSSQPTWLSSDPGLWLLAAVGVGMAAAFVPLWLAGARCGTDFNGCNFARSALIARSSEVKGIADALSALRDNAWLLGFVAIGLIAFGCYSLLEAMFRRINEDEQ